MRQKWNKRYGINNSKEVNEMNKVKTIQHNESDLWIIEIVNEDGDTIIRKEADLTLLRKLLDR